ncbi:host range protein [Pigeonpox virus]|uniref:Host range protein n=1 Tax=Pigeonpox virus TaxID=10264 RepID=A0A068EEW6_9POXV|nr:host range protein [Pigeonpox virus]AID46721.1 host range protein [Pigeonpox virus]WCL40162.1 host range protein [Pigeonpox virus]
MMEDDVRHLLSLEIPDKKVRFDNINLKEGDSYGCTIFVAANGRKEITLLIYLYPDWSEVSFIKPIVVTVNNISTHVSELLNSMFLIVYSVTFEINECAYIEIFSDEVNTSKYPTLMMDMKRNMYSVIDKAETCAHVVIDNKEK